jgi:hypothetical protein
MAQRQITEADVEAALKHTIGTPQPGDGGNLIVRGYAPGQRILKVVLSGDKRTVVTVMGPSE